MRQPIGGELLTEEYGTRQIKRPQRAVSRNID